MSANTNNNKKAKEKTFNGKLSQIHFGIILDFRLSFDHFKIPESKIKKALGLLRKLQNVYPRTTLLTPYKFFTGLLHYYILS